LSAIQAEMAAALGKLPVENDVNGVLLSEPGGIGIGDVRCGIMGTPLPLDKKNGVAGACITLLAPVRP